jgi:hypothetical protein
LWDPRQWLWLSLIYLCLFLPFFFAANCLVLALTYFRTAIAPIYAANLLGAGFGALLMVLVQFYASTMVLLTALSLIIAITVMLQLLKRRAKLSELIGCGLCIALIFMLPAQLKPSQFKALSKQLLIPQSHVIIQRHSPTVSLSIVESQQFPFRLSRGLSMLSPYPIPQQRAIYFNGDGPFPINRWQGAESVAYLTQQTSAIGYQLLAKPNESKVLLIGLAGGEWLQQAAWYQVQHTDTVELDEQLIEVMTNTLADYWGWADLHPNATIFHGDARAFVLQHPASYGLIQLPLTSIASAVGSGTQGITANYMLTRQALDALWQALSSQGILSITLPLDIPPRLSMRMLTSLTQLLTTQVATPVNHLLLIRNWNTITIVLSKSPLTALQHDKASAFSNERAFDLLSPAATNPLPKQIYHQLPQNYFAYALSELLSPQRQQFIDDYKFNISPTSDDRPYFFHFIRMQHLPEFYALFKQGGLLLIEQAYPLLWGIIILSTLLSIILIIGPLIWLRRRGKVNKNSPVAMLSVWPWLNYFLLIGIAFMVVEMTLLPRFIRFLSQPIISAIVVLAALLVFAGLGSLLSSKLKLSGARHRNRIAVSVALLLVVYNYMLPVVFDMAGSWPLLLKLVASFVLLLPLGIMMGMPLPLGLQAVVKQHPQWLPWAWGVNSCASVVSTSLGTLLAVHLGHSAMLLLAAICYGLIILLPIPEP